MINIDIQIKSGDYLLKENEEATNEYYLIFDIDNDSITLIKQKGTPYDNETVHLYSDILNNFSMVVLSENQYRTELIKESYIYKNLNCQKVIGIKYIHGDKAIIIDIPDIYFNGREFVKPPEGFYSSTAAVCT